MSWVFPDPTMRARALITLFTLSVRTAYPYGEVLTALDGDRVVGAAVWLPPGRFPLSVADKIRGGPALVRLLPQAPRDLGRLFRFLGAAEEEAAAVPTWHLDLLGLEPAAQGGGVGGRLLAPTLARIAAAGAVVRLQTWKEVNVAFYQRQGLRVVGDDLPLGPAGPRRWTIG